MWIVGALAIIGAGWAFCLAVQPAMEGLVEVRVRGVSIDPQAGSPIVLLEELQGERLMPIWVGMFEARAIAMEVEKVVPPRPMTHDLMKNLLDEVKAQVARIVITELKDNTFFARIVLSAGGTALELDARPVAVVAGIGDDGAAPRARRARLAEGEQSLVLVEEAPSPALRARHRMRAGLGPRPVADRAAGTSSVRTRW